MTTTLRFLAALPLALARDAWLNFIDPAARWARVTHLPLDNESQP